MKDKKWIQKAVSSHTAHSLHKQLHIPLKKRIPQSELNAIVRAKIGTRLKNRNIEVTRILKQRAVLANNLRHLKRRE